MVLVKVIGDIRCVCEIRKMWLNHSLLVDCVSQRFGYVWFDDELVSGWASPHKNRCDPIQLSTKSMWDASERRIVQGILSKGGPDVHSYYLLWSKELLPNGSLRPRQYKQESSESLPYYLFKSNSTHSQKLSLMSVSKKKQFSFVSTNPAPHWFACHPESSLLNPHPCIVSSASFGHSTAPSRKREDIILLLNKVLGDEARCSFFLNTVRGNDGSMFPVKSTPSRFKCLLSQWYIWREKGEYS